MFTGIAAKADSPLSEIHDSAFFAPHVDTRVSIHHGRAGDLANDISSLVSSEDILGAIPEAIAEIFFAEEE